MKDALHVRRNTPGVDNRDILVVDTGADQSVFVVIVARWARGQGRYCKKRGNQ